MTVSRGFARAAFVALAAFVGVMSLAPGPAAPGAGLDLTERLSVILFGAPDYGDKIGHFFAYAALGFVARFAERGPRRLRVDAIAALFVYGLLLEGAQMAIPGRDGDLLDAGANLAGVTAGYVGAVAASRLATAMRRRAREA